MGLFMHLPSQGILIFSAFVKFVWPSLNPSSLVRTAYTDRIHTQRENTLFAKCISNAMLSIFICSVPFQFAFGLSIENRREREQKKCQLPYFAMQDALSCAVYLLRKREETKRFTHHEPTQINQCQQALSHADETSLS